MFYVPLTLDRLKKINTTFAELDTCRETATILQQYNTAKDEIIEQMETINARTVERLEVSKKIEKTYLLSIEARDVKIKSIEALNKSLRRNIVKTKLALFITVPVVTFGLILAPVLLKYIP